MKSLVYRLSAIILAVLVSFSFGFSQNVKKEKLKVLYAGGTAEISAYGTTKPTPEEKEASVKLRMTAFESMLKNYFTDVTIMRDRDYKEEISYNYDITIMDGIPPIRVPLYTEKDDKGNYSVYKYAGYISEEFDSPMLTIAEISDKIGRRIGLKLDWYCLCLDAFAYGFNKSHPIFNGPFPVKLTIEERPTPKDALAFQRYSKEIIPPTQKMWRVQKHGYMTDQGVRVGMVCRPWGFLDSPETEVISGGVSLKSPDAIAIGRHGNFFHWGFASSPSDMTDEAVAVFANAVVYASKFKNNRVISRKYDDRKTTRHEMFFVFARSQQDSAKMVTDYPYLYTGESKTGLVIDEDAKTLGIPTYDKAILDKAIGMLEQGRNIESAQRILDRYTLATFSSPKEWRAWFEKYKKDLFFSESGGFYFLINTSDKQVYGNDYSLMQIERCGRAIAVSETNNDNPVNIATKLLRLDNGEIVAIAKVKIEKGFHIYAKVSKSEPYSPTIIEFNVPAGYTKLKETNSPASIKYGDRGTFIYMNEVIFYQRFIGDGKDGFKCKISYQCCDDQVCIPPTEKEFTVTF